MLATYPWSTVLVLVLGIYVVDQKLKRSFTLMLRPLVLLELGFLLSWFNINNAAVASWSCSFKASGKRVGEVDAE